MNASSTAALEKLPLLEILIPTFNRSECLKKNLRLLDQQLHDAGLTSEVRVIVSDNASPDGTAYTVSTLATELRNQIMLLRSEVNVGLEANVVQVLRAAEADFVMFLGDDDYLPDGYLADVVARLRKGWQGCIIPGFSGLRQDGYIVPQRDGAARTTSAGFLGVLRLSHYGHQLSGLVVPRERLLQNYLARPENRNLYPFIFFVGHALQYGGGVYLPEYQVLVTQGNSKDWEYDRSGLLTHVFRNYQTLYPAAPLKVAACCAKFLWTQSWRLRLGKSPKKSFLAVLHICSDRGIRLSVKVATIFLYPVLYGRALIRFMLRQVAC